MLRGRKGDNGSQEMGHPHFSSMTTTKRQTSYIFTSSCFSKRPWNVYVTDELAFRCGHSTVLLLLLSHFYFSFFTFSILKYIYIFFTFISLDSHCLSTRVQRRINTFFIYIYNLLDFSIYTHISRLLSGKCFLHYRRAFIVRWLWNMFEWLAPTFP